MPVQQTRKKVEFNLKDLLDLMKEQTMMDTNAHAIATINSFDPDTQTVSATINYKRTYFRKDSNGSYVPQLVAYPPLIDVPVLIVGGGTGNLTFPIAKGDQCLILFNDRDMSNWFAGSNGGPVASNRLHSMADGIALIGLHSKSNPIEDYDPDRTVLSQATAKVALDDDSLIEISNESTSLGDILTQLISTLETLTTAMSAADPTNVSATVGAPSAVAASQLTSIQTLLEGLLL